MPHVQRETEPERSRVFPGSQLSLLLKKFWMWKKRLLKVSGNPRMSGCSEKELVGAAACPKNPVLQQLRARNCL